MELGIFAKTFPRKTLEETLDAVVAHGLKHVQFNLSCVGLPTLPERLEQEQCAEIARALRDRGITMAAISGTFNPLLESLKNPGVSPRTINSIQKHTPVILDLDRLETLASCCKWLDTRLITLSTGTRDANNMWKWHEENSTRRSWDALVEITGKIIEVADRHQIVMAFEPELSNVVNSVCKASRLLDEIRSPWLKVVLDLSNLVRPDDISRMGAVIGEAFDWLGDDIALMHIKELGRDGHPGELAPGQGILDYGLILNELERVGYNGTLVMHGLSEEQVEPGVKFMRKMMGFSKGTM